MASESLPAGARLIDGKVKIVDEFIEPDLLLPKDVRTADIILQIANSISESTKLTVDCPSMNTNNQNFMPILDIQVKVVKNQIEYRFYKKSMSNHRVMLARSAMPPNIKRNSLAQEVIRRLWNTSRDLPWSEKASILTEFSHSMMCSGYSEKFRLEIIQAGVKGFENQCEVADNGGTPVHRPRSYNLEERTKKKMLTKTSWYRPYDAVGFFPGTPNSELVNEIKAIVVDESKRIDMNVKILETGGISLAKQLVKTDLSGCLVPQCFICKCDLPGASHTRSGNAYNIKCKLCAENGVDASYEGETGDNLIWRQKQHAECVKGKVLSNGLAKHLQLYHKDNVGDINCFSFKSVKCFPKIIDRLAFEGVNIHNSTANIIMNSKSEFHQPATPRVNVTNEVQETRPPGR